MGLAYEVANHPKVREALSTFVAIRGWYPDDLVGIILEVAQEIEHKKREEQRLKNAPTEPLSTARRVP